MGTVEKRNKHKKRRFVSSEEKLERELKDCILAKYCCARHSSTCIKIKRRILRRMTSFGRTKVKKTSKSDQVYRIRESPFSKGLQGYTRVS